MQTKTFKRTTIFISLGEKTTVYDSPEAIPQSLRNQLLRSTRSMNSATILIADRGGRQEIQKILEGQPSCLDGSLRTNYFQRPEALAAGALPFAPASVLPASQPALGQRSPLPVELPPPAPSPVAPARWKRLAELSLPAALGIALWLLFTLK
jgi:hypothetical protein